MSDQNVPPSQPAQPAPLSPAEDKQWASFAHFGGILGPLPVIIIYFVFKDRGSLVKNEGKEALNWQITFVIAYVAAWIITSVLSSILWVLAAILWLLPLAVWVVNIVFSIQGGIKVNNGGSYRYPFNFRFIN